jgi:uncharacterized membrane protein YgcG
MAESLKPVHHTGKCPVCLRPVTLPDRYDYGQRARCPKCRSSYPIESISPYYGSRPSEALEVIEEDLDREVEPTGQTLAWLSAIVSLIVLASVCIWFGQTLKGPRYLLFSGIFFVGSIIAATVLRHRWKDEWYISVLALLTFEAIGGFRIWLGLQADMKKFGFLVAIMLIGVVMFFMRAKDESGFGILGSCGIGGGGGGCGGGGCGGGWCGGCGG